MNLILLVQLFVTQVNTLLLFVTQLYTLQLITL